MEFISSHLEYIITGVLGIILNLVALGKMMQKYDGKIETFDKFMSEANIAMAKTFLLEQGQIDKDRRLAALEKGLLDLGSEIREGFTHIYDILLNGDPRKRQ